MGTMLSPGASPAGPGHERIPPVPSPLSGPNPARLPIIPSIEIQRPAPVISSVPAHVRRNIPKDDLSTTPMTAITQQAREEVPQPRTNAADSSASDGTPPNSGDTPPQRRSGPRGPQSEAHKAAISAGLRRRYAEGPVTPTEHAPFTTTITFLDDTTENLTADSPAPVVQAAIKRLSAEVATTAPPDTHASEHIDALIERVKGRINWTMLKNAVSGIGSPDSDTNSDAGLILAALYGKTIKTAVSLVMTKHEIPEARRDDLTKDSLAAVHNRAPDILAQSAADTKNRVSIYVHHAVTETITPRRDGQPRTTGKISRPTENEATDISTPTKRRDISTDTTSVPRPKRDMSQVDPASVGGKLIGHYKLHTSLTEEALAHRLEWSVEKLRKIFYNETTPTPIDVAALLQELGTDSATAAPIVAQARENYRAKRLKPRNTE